MPIVTTSCLVLQTYRFGDTSKILRLLTREHGPVSALARGALRPRSRMSGVLEPFVEGVVTLYLKPNRDLHTLSGFELVRSRQALYEELLKTVVDLNALLAAVREDPKRYVPPVSVF